MRFSFRIVSPKFASLRDNDLRKTQRCLLADASLCRVAERCSTSRCLSALHFAGAASLHTSSRCIGNVAEQAVLIRIFHAAAASSSSTSELLAARVEMFFFFSFSYFFSSAIESTRSFTATAGNKQRVSVRTVLYSTLTLVFHQ